MFLANSPAEFYGVQGVDSSLPSIYVSGNPPEPPGSVLSYALLSGLALVLLVCFLYALLRRAEARAAWPRWRSLLARAILVVGFFVLWEASVRGVMEDSPYLVYVPDPVVAWKLNPAMFKGTRLEHARPQDGPGDIADWRHPVEREPGAWRALFLGDSQLLWVTDGVSPLGLTYPKAARDLLASRHPERRFEVVNAGMSGFSSHQGLLLLETSCLKYRRDLVVTCFGYHDASPAYATDRMVITRSPLLHFLRTHLYRSQLVLILRKAVLTRGLDRGRDDPGRQKYARVPLEEFEQNMRAFLDLGRREGFRVAFLLEPIQPDREDVIEHTEPYREVLRRLSREQGVPLVDAFGFMASLPPQEVRPLFDDMIHLNEAGHRRLAAWVADHLPVEPPAAP